MPQLLLVFIFSQRNNAVKGTGILGVCTEKSDTNKLESLAGGGILQHRLNQSALNLSQRFFVQEIKIFLSLGDFGGIFNIEKSVVKHKCSGLCIFCGKPMHITLYLSAVNGISVSGFKIGGSMKASYASIVILLDTYALNNISAHETNLSVRLQTEELRRWNLSKVISINIDFTCHNDFTGTKLGSLRVIRNLKSLLLVLGIVVNNDLDRLSDSGTANCVFIKIGTNTRL